MDKYNLSDNITQITNDIAKLQVMEDELTQKYETASASDKPAIQNNIISISSMRMNLYETLSNISQLTKNSFSTSISGLSDQQTALSITQHELNKTNQQINLLHEEKNNKLRLVEINNFYSNKYEEYSKLMKILLFTLCPIIVLAWLNNKGFVPQVLYYILVVLVIVIGNIYFWSQYVSIMMRDNMDFQKFDWNFSQSTAPKYDPKTAPADIINPWYTTSIPGAEAGAGTCVGAACCSEGQLFRNNVCTTVMQNK